MITTEITGALGLARRIHKYRRIQRRRRRRVVRIRVRAILPAVAGEAVRPGRWRWGVVLEAAVVGRGRWVGLRRWRRVGVGVGWVVEGPGEGGRRRRRRRPAGGGVGEGVGGGEGLGVGVCIIRVWVLVWVWIWIWVWVVTVVLHHKQNKTSCCSVLWLGKRQLDEGMDSDRNRWEDEEEGIGWFLRLIGG